MKRFLLFVSILLYVFFSLEKGQAQTQETQTVPNGKASSAINFPNTGCIYNWVNNTPGIGLAASGTGNIASFIAVNKGSTPVTATINVTPVQSQGYAYITNADDASVSVIDLNTRMITATLHTGTTPIYVAVSPDGSTVYISNFYSNDITVIDAPYSFPQPSIKVGANPAGLAVTPDGTELYSCNSTNVSVINIATRQIITNITIGQYPDFVTFSPDGSKAYVTNNYLNTVSVINTSTNKVTSSFSAGTSPTGEIVNPNGKYLYVANTYDNDVSVFSTTNNNLITNIPVGVGPLGVTISPDGNTLYVVNSGDNSTSTLAPGSVSVINTATNKVTNTIGLGTTYPLGISITPDGSQLYVVNNSTNLVTIINTSNNATTGTIGVGQQPNSLGNFIAKAQPCTSSPFQYTIIVNPTSNIVASTVNGSVTACSGSTGGRGENIPDFTVSATGLVGDMITTAPGNFQISLSPNGGYSNTVTLTPVNGTVSSTTIYVEATNSAPVGPIQDNIVISSINAPSQDVAVYGVVGAQTSPSVTIAASANNSCTNTAITFTATPTNGGDTPVYQWQVNGQNAGTNNPVFTSSTLADGDVVSCMMTSNAACAPPAGIASNEITMNIASQVNVPSVSIMTSDNNTCAGSPVTFTATPVNAGSVPAYQWQVNGNNAGTNSATFTTSTLVNGDVVTCIMTGNAACSVPASATSNEIVMSFNALPVVNAGGNKTIAAGKGIVLNATATGNITDITWNPATGLSNYKILDPVASPSSTTIYTLTVQTSDGCVGSDMATVQVTYPIIIPNTFTP